MINKGIRLRQIIGINLRFIHSAIMIGYGWICWQWASPEWWGLGLMAILALAGGIIHFIATVNQIVAMIGRDRKVDAYKEQGGIARADRLAKEGDLRRRGLIR